MLPKSFGIDEARIIKVLCLSSARFNQEIVEFIYKQRQILNTIEDDLLPEACLLLKQSIRFNQLLEDYENGIEYTTYKDNFKRN